MKKFITTALIVLLAVMSCFSQAVTENLKDNYVASTSWVAAIAELAGIDNVTTIAPANLRHPPEYEITADDMARVMNAKLVLNAGYERMMKTINEAADVDPEKVVKVKTTNTVENLTNMVNMLSEKAGTQVTAQERLGRYLAMIENARSRIAELGYGKLTVFAHKDQAELARDLGLNVLATFSSPLSSDQIADAARSKYDLVIDNAHNPGASPIAEVSPQSAIMVWSNFPDHLGGDALCHVVENNIELLFNAL